MKQFTLIITLLASFSLAGQGTAEERIIPNNPDSYRALSAVHAGAGDMGFTQLVGRNDLATNFLYLHAGTINGKSGIGHHFHHSIEEMYVLLSGQAEFTVNGRTSVLKAPVVVPCKLGDSHAIYNTSDEPVKWLNFAVSSIKGRGDAFDLGDDRVGASLDPIPVFVSSQLDKARLRTERHPYTEAGIQYRRLLGPEVFQTNWDHVDHFSIPAGGKFSPVEPSGTEEVYYVVSGSGKVSLNSLEKNISPDVAFYRSMGESLTVINDGAEELELLVIGIADNKGGEAKDTPIALQMDFLVEEENRQAFEDMYHTVYVPAMKVQQGYIESKLLRLFPEAVAREIQAEETEYNYSIQIYFDSEESRRRWVASPQHQIAWPAAEKLVKKYRWRGYDVMGEDHQ